MKRKISEVFLPAEIEAIAREYAYGESARQIIIDQCRYILIGSDDG